MQLSLVKLHDSLLVNLKVGNPTLLRDKLMKFSSLSSQILPLNFFFFNIYCEDRERRSKKETGDPPLSLLLLLLLVLSRVSSVAATDHGKGPGTSLHGVALVNLHPVACKSSQSREGRPLIGDRGVYCLHFEVTATDKVHLCLNPR